MFFAFFIFLAYTATAYAEVPTTAEEVAAEMTGLLMALPDVMKRKPEEIQTALNVLRGRAETLSRTGIAEWNRPRAKPPLVSSVYVPPYDRLQAEWSDDLNEFENAGLFPLQGWEWDLARLSAVKPASRRRSLLTRLVRWAPLIYSGTGLTQVISKDQVKSIIENRLRKWPQVMLYDFFPDELLEGLRATLRREGLSEATARVEAARLTGLPLLNELPTPRLKQRLVLRRLSPTQVHLLSLSETGQNLLRNWDPLLGNIPGARIYVLESDDFPQAGGRPSYGLVVVAEGILEGKKIPYLLNVRGVAGKDLRPLGRLLQEDFGTNQIALSEALTNQLPNTPPQRQATVIVHKDWGQTPFIDKFSASAAVFKFASSPPEIIRREPDAGSFESKIAQAWWNRVTAATPVTDPAFDVEANLAEIGDLTRTEVPAPLPEGALVSWMRRYFPDATAWSLFRALLQYVKGPVPDEALERLQGLDIALINFGSMKLSQQPPSLARARFLLSLNRQDPDTIHWLSEDFAAYPDREVWIGMMQNLPHQEGYYEGIMPKIAKIPVPDSWFDELRRRDGKRFVPILESLAQVLFHPGTTLEGADIDRLRIQVALQLRDRSVRVLNDRAIDRNLRDFIKKASGDADHPFQSQAREAKVGCFWRLVALADAHLEKPRIQYLAPSGDTVAVRLRNKHLYLTQLLTAPLYVLAAQCAKYGGTWSVFEFKCRFEK